MLETVVIGNCTLYKGDCFEIMPQLTEKFDAVVTDPPYGIGADKGKNLKPSNFKGTVTISRHYYDNEWDRIRPQKQIFDFILLISKYQIIWGGNYFSDYLPVSPKWLWWDKCQTMPTYGDGELAWTNLKGSTPRKFTLSNNKILAQRLERFHPTQKPIPLMQWCVSLLPLDCQNILDPFMGSGSTGVACVKTGHHFVGIEKDSEYFDIACKRIEKACQQPDLFHENA